MKLSCCAIERMIGFVKDSFTWSSLECSRPLHLGETNEKWLFLPSPREKMQRYIYFL